MSTMKQVRKMAFKTIDQLKKAISEEDDELIEMYVYDLQLLKEMAEIHWHDDDAKYIDLMLKTLSKTENGEYLCDKYDILTYMNSSRHLKMIDPKFAAASQIMDDDHLPILSYYRLFEEYSEFMFDDIQSQTSYNYFKYNNIWFARKYDLKKRPIECEESTYETDKAAADSLPYLHRLKVLIKNKEDNTWMPYMLID